jgi:hypothetical protein
MVGTRAQPAVDEDGRPYTSRLYPDSLALHEWQRRWRDELVSLGHPGNGLYVISDAFAEDVGGRETYHVTAGYSTRIAERFSMEYARLWPQRGRIRVHWILPLPIEWSREKVRGIEERMHKYCAIYARATRLRTTEFYLGRALPLLYACFQSIQREYGLAVPHHLDTALGGVHAWVYSRPSSHPPIDIFAQPMGEFERRWRAFRREQMDLMRAYRVQAPAAIAGRQGPRTRSARWQVLPVRGGGEWVDGAGVRHVRYPPGGGFAPL